MYHPLIQKLDSAASDFHEAGMMAEKNLALRLGGIYQQYLLDEQPFPRSTRYLHAQWVWALGHIGLLHQLIRWFRLQEPETRLVLYANGSANDHFLAALAPFLTILPLPDNGQYPLEAMYRAVYFGCPDGVTTLARFYKRIELDCRDIHLLKLSPAEEAEAEGMLAALNVKRPYVALQARAMTHDAKRNVSDAQIAEALAPYVGRGYAVVSTGLDPRELAFPSVLTLPDPQRASFLLSAACDQFIGSNSGAWTIAHAYRRPVEIMNDYEHAAWIYP